MQKPEIIGELSTIHHPDIVASIEKATELLPAGIKETFSGVTTQIAQRLAILDPKVKKEKARGHGSTTDYVSAYYRPSKRLVRITQENNSRSGYIPAYSNIIDTYLHELGHDFDDAATNGKSISQSKEFKKAYKKVIDHIKNHDPQMVNNTIRTFSYFFSKKDFKNASQKKQKSARDEVVAEGFQIIMGGHKCDYNKWFSVSFSELFTPCMKIIEEHILAIAPDADLYPEGPFLSPRFIPAAITREPAKVQYDWESLIDQSVIDYQDVIKGKTLNKWEIAKQLGIKLKDKEHLTTQHPARYGKSQTVKTSYAPTISS